MKNMASLEKSWRLLAQSFGIGSYPKPATVFLGKTRIPLSKRFWGLWVRRGKPVIKRIPSRKHLDLLEPLNGTFLPCVPAWAFVAV